MALKRTFNSDHRHKNRASEELEKLVVDFGIRNPHLGQAQVSAHINQKTNYEISSTGARLIWQRHNMHTMNEVKARSWGKFGHQEGRLAALV